jgi:hypothetical protein
MGSDRTHHVRGRLPHRRYLPEQDCDPRSARGRFERFGEAARQLRRWLWGMGVILVLLLTIAWEMVFKPGV